MDWVVVKLHLKAKVFIASVIGGKKARCHGERQDTIIVQMRTVHTFGGHSWCCIWLYTIKVLEVVVGSMKKKLISGYLID